LRDKLVLMQIEGDSMSPTIMDGDVAMVDMSRRDLRPGPIYALGIDEIVVIKRVELQSGSQMTILSDNRDAYPPFTSIIQGCPRGRPGHLACPPARAAGLPLAREKVLNSVQKYGRIVPKWHDLNPERLCTLFYQPFLDNFS
jgi:hypothetical protein